MLQVRKLVLAVAAATSMASGMAHALGLGEVSVKSALNEPLVAEIELLDTKGLSSDEIRSKLASVEDFSRAGVDRQFFLNNLKFTPVIRQGGKSFVRVTSSQAVREPFLNFLLEVYWPAGRLLKEYTLLLDPPMYTPQELVYRSAPVTAPVATRAPERQVNTTIQPRRTAATPAPRAAAQPALQGDQYRVQKNDTLWEIALRANRSGGSVHQTMLAIQDLNPDAFIDGNINRLKTGQVLKLPNAEQIRQRSRTQAVAEFQGQVDAWRTGAPVERQLDARQRETAAAAPARAEQGDNLRLVAGETGQSESGSDSGATDRALTDQLALTKEQLDSTRLQNEDLASRVEELNSQVEKLQRLLELKNTQLANLQNLSDEEQAALEAAAEELEAVAAEVEEAAAEIAPEQLLADEIEALAEDESSVVDAAEAAVEAEVADEAEQVVATEPAAEEAAEEVVEAEDPAVAETVAAEPEAAPQSKPAPVAFEPPPEPKSFVEELMENPMFLPAAGGGVALLLLLLLLRRRQQTAQEQEILPPEDFDEEPQAGDDLQDVEDDLDVLDGVLDDLDSEIEEPADFVDDLPAQAQELGNPIAEAENFIAFGRFSQAADVLLKAIDADPQREDLRFKLLEVYADLEDRNAFLQQVEELNAMGASQSEMDTMRQRFPHMLGEDDGGLNLDDIMLDMPEAPAAVVEDEATELGDMLAGDIPALDDLLGEAGSVAEETADDEFASLLEAADSELAETAELDTTVDYEPVQVEAGPADEAVAETDDLDMDSFELPEIEDLTLEDLELPEVDGLDELKLDDDLSLEDLDFAVEDGELQPEQAAGAEPEFGLDLDLSLPLDETPAADFVDELDLSSLETELEENLESVESSLDALQDEVQETLQAVDTAPVEDAADELDALFDLDAELDLDTPEVAAASESNDDVLAALEQELDDDFGFLQGDDEDKTKLDLASAWIDMGDIEGAREILDEVLREGAPEHQELAKELLAKIG